MSKRRRRDVQYYNWERKPVTFNTKSRWQKLGYRPRKDITAPCGVLYNNYGKACDLFNSRQVEMIPGKAARIRRGELQYSIARGQIRKLAEDWHAWNRYASDDVIQDAAIAISAREFKDWWDMLIDLNQSRRDMLRFEFEKEVCQLMGRDYADYAYCETF